MSPRSTTRKNSNKILKWQKTLAVLQDTKWHCRDHEFSHVESKQLAGGGGFQTLGRGNRKRDGLVLKTETRPCALCGQKTPHIKWTGDTKPSNAPSHMSQTLIIKILKHYRYTDVQEHRQLPKHQLVVDHRFPMVRWGGPEEKLADDMPASEIERKFQLLKKVDGDNRNSLKTRVCEKCIKTGNRGTPFGIEYFYQGALAWDQDVPAEGPEAEQGCMGCGWYDFAKWRDGLNSTFSVRKAKKSGALKKRSTAR